MLATPLTRAQFESALHKGQGRALMHTRKWGLAGIDDLVLAACFKNFAYDTQCESNRAEWLLEMFADSPEYPRFSAAIVEQLQLAYQSLVLGKNPDNSAEEEDKNSPELYHLCPIASAMALRTCSRSFE